MGTGLTMFVYDWADLRLGYRALACGDIQEFGVGSVEMGEYALAGCRGLRWVRMLPGDLDGKWPVVSCVTEFRVPLRGAEAVDRMAGLGLWATFDSDAWMVMDSGAPAMGKYEGAQRMRSISPHGLARFPRCGGRYALWISPCWR